MLQEDKAALEKAQVVKRDDPRFAELDQNYLPKSTRSSAMNRSDVIIGLQTKGSQ
jgi:hypothetical protein